MDAHQVDPEVPPKEGSGGPVPDSQEPGYLKRLNSKFADLAAGKKYLVGVAIFQRRPDSESIPQPWQLLLVKRAADEEAFPNNWELPGGHVEPHETVHDTVNRETVEETGLIVETVIGEFEELFWTSRSSGNENVQFNYAVTVAQPMEIRLNPEEHSDWMWANEDDVDGLEMTPAMNKVLKDAFTFSRTHMP